MLSSSVGAILIAKKTTPAQLCGTVPGPALRLQKRGAFERHQVMLLLMRNSGPVGAILIARKATPGLINGTAHRPALRF